MLDTKETEMKDLEGPTQVENPAKPKSGNTGDEVTVGVYLSGKKICILIFCFASIAVLIGTLTWHFTKENDSSDDSGEDSSDGSDISEEDFTKQVSKR